MQTDLRGTPLFREALQICEKLRQPGTGLISEAADVHVAPDGRHAVFTGTIMDALEGSPPTRVCEVDLTSGNTRVLTFGPHTDRLPKYSPDARHIAFLSDRHKTGDFQLSLLDPASGAARSTPHVEGWVEYLHWSPDGTRILLGVAGHGADIAGGQGAVTSKAIAENLPTWIPAVESGDESYRWRRAWIYELASDRVRQVSPSSSNIWEAVWCGNDAFAAVVSPGPGEGLWYSARLHVFEIETASSRELNAPQYQQGWPAASPSGKYLAIVEAICSDRWLVAGELRLVETASGKAHLVDTCGVDITYTEWRSDRHLLLAGHRAFESIVGVYDAASGAFTEVWSSGDLSTGGFYMTISGLNETGDCVLVGESFVRAPEVAVIRQGKYQTVKSFDLDYTHQASVIEAADRVTWEAPDGLEMQGWLLRPKAKRPYPLVMNVHGGPVWHWHPVWLGRRGIALLMLLERGYAVFLPNPRGSSGRGTQFARRVVGDLGGADARDCLTGLDYLVASGVADPARLGVTGVSYGGFMTYWLVTQDSRFAAAAAVAPTANHVTQHLLSNIPGFVSLFLGDHYSTPAGKYFERSPITYVHDVKTPVLNICGALDRCSPSQEAMQFHNALLENGVESVLVTYPEEGHGIRKLPAAADCAARIVDWFETHLRAGRASGGGDPGVLDRSV